MEYTKPTYEEYCKASKYAVVRYRFGVYVQIICAVLLLFLAYYTVTNVEEMKANPIEYAEEKMDAICSPRIYQITDYYGPSGNIENIEKEK